MTEEIKKALEEWAKSDRMTENKPEAIAWGILAFHGLKTNGITTIEEYVKSISDTYPGLIPDNMFKLVSWHVKNIIRGPWEMQMVTPLPNGKIVAEVWQEEFVKLITRKGDKDEMPEM